MVAAAVSVAVTFGGLFSLLLLTILFLSKSIDKKFSLEGVSRKRFRMTIFVVVLDAVLDGDSVVHLLLLLFLRCCRCHCCCYCRYCSSKIGF